MKVAYIAGPYRAVTPLEILRNVHAAGDVQRLLGPNGVVLSFGWNSAGMGKSRGFEVIEVLLVNHGSAHNDTICMAERRVQAGLFSSLTPATSKSATADEM